MSEIRKGKTKSEEYKQKCRENIWITNGKETKLLNKFKCIPDGWIKGRIKEKIWITNGKETTLLNKFENIPEGWVKGRIIKN